MKKGRSFSLDKTLLNRIEADAKELGISVNRHINETFAAHWIYSPRQTITNNLKKIELLNEDDDAHNKKAEINTAIEQIRAALEKIY